MATFLQLVNDVERESGTVAQSQRLTTVAAAIGRQEKIVEWVRDAWRMIQVSRDDWPWRKAEFTAPLSMGQSRYAAVELGLLDYGGWPKANRWDDTFTLYDAALGKADEQPLDRCDYDLWRTMYGVGLPGLQRPAHWSVDMAGRLMVGPPPERAYVLSGEYVREPQILMEDGDVPIGPEANHRAIVWQAMILLATHDEAPTALQMARSFYATEHRNMVNSQHPMVTL